MTDNDILRIGVLALQGSFREHMALLNRIPHVQAVEVRTAEELRGVAGLIIPGGESTTMALVAERWGLIPALKEFAEEKRPIWGTCAGLIFLANRATGQKTGGQALLGGLDCLVHRNFFGAQINSFETKIPSPDCLPDVSGTQAVPLRGEERSCSTREPFRAVFIRAPAITEVGPDVQVLAKYELTPEERTAHGMDSVIVAVRQDQLMATSFHPELTQDVRWHMMFVELVKEHADLQAKSGRQVASAKATAVHVAAEPSGETKLGRQPTRPADLPVFQ